MKTLESIKAKFRTTRHHTEAICKPLELEDFVPQPIVDVSPPKWHLAHTTWFFEQFILVPYSRNYRLFHEDFAFHFNSYYNHAGDRVLRSNRGLMTRPSVGKVLEYRTYVTDSLSKFLDQENLPEEVWDRVILGINHEEQHQELLAYDLKYILGNQPTFPIYGPGLDTLPEKKGGFLKLDEGIYRVGFEGNGFCFDNELGRHRVFLESFEISDSLVSNAEYLEFIIDGGYQNFDYWLDEGLQFVRNEKIEAPLYWHKQNGKWWNYTLQGFKKVDPLLPVQHVSFYEASAFASWKGCRLPTEFEWEAAAEQLRWGQLWEWTNSAYLPYPGFKKVEGALGEYNGKFMVSQHVLRGASVATAKEHSRITYRNFFHPSSRWIFSGFRLAK
jgi:ergothioneine biosynthesis protein EgtB